METAIVPGYVIGPVGDIHLEVTSRSTWYESLLRIGPPIILHKYRGSGTLLMQDGSPTRLRHGGSVAGRRGNAIIGVNVGGIDVG